RSWWTAPSASAPKLVAAFGDDGHPRDLGEQSAGELVDLGRCDFASGEEAEVDAELERGQRRRLGLEDEEWFLFERSEYVFHPCSSLSCVGSCAWRAGWGGPVWSPSQKSDRGRDSMRRSESIRPAALGRPVARKLFRRSRTVAGCAGR